MSLFAELKRRNVIRMAGLYLVGAWLVVQVVGTLLPVFEAPAWVMKTLVGLLAVGFVPALIFSWVFELTPDGIRRDADVPPEQSIASQTARRMDRTIIAVLLLALGYFAFDKFALAPRREASQGPIAAGPTGSPAKPAGAQTIPTDSSIAVLPFVNMSSDKEQEYFSDGLSEELLNQLAQVQQLRVIARTSSFSFKGKDADVATIARALGVAHVLEGSVRKAGQTLRITAQLIRTADSAHLWSQSYDRELSDVFKVQDEIAREVVAALKVKLLPAQALPKSQGTGNTEAYEHYLRATDLIRRNQLRAMPIAIAELQRALELDPNYANAYGALAYAQVQFSDVAESQPQRAKEIGEAFASIERALALDPSLAYAYTMRGFMRFSRAWDWQGARADYERAFALDPNNVDLLSFYSHILMLDGKPDDAIAMVRRATELDPLSVNAWHRLGLVQFAAGRDADARSSWRRALQSGGDARWPNFLLGYLELRDGRAEGALPFFQASDETFRWAGTAMVEFTLGHAREAEQMLDALKTKYAAGSAFQIASVHAWRGEKDQAFEWLDRAYAQRDAGMPRLRYDPTLASLHGDPRFAALLKKMGFPGATP